MSNIILIGMPASGKSTLGVVLAKTMNMRFLDTDLLIQEHESALLQEIINKQGNDYFKKIEQYILRSISETNTVISTGGSAVYYPDAMENFKRAGSILYLKAKLETIEERLNNITTRGITLAPGQTIQHLYEERIPLYEKYADITVSCDGFSVEQVVEKVVAKYLRPLCY